MTAAACAVLTCDRPALTKGLCSPHYRRLWKRGDIQADVPIGGASLLDRFMARVEPEPMSGCWLWMGARDGKGYGIAGRHPIGNGSTSSKAHRIMYSLLVGPIPNGLLLDHLCRNRSCCAPAHLEPVDSRTNALRGESPTVVAWKTNRCVSGRHELVGDNIRWHVDGHRMCRACINLSAVANRARRRKAAV